MIPSGNTKLCVKSQGVDLVDPRDSVSGEQWKMNSQRERRIRYAVCAAIARSVTILTRFRAKVAKPSSDGML